MGLRISKTNLSPIGLDFGTDCVRLLQVVNDTPPRVVAAAEAPIPHEIRDDVHARREFLIDTIQDLVRHGGFKGKRVSASLPAALTHVVHLRLAKGDYVAQTADMHEQLRGKLPIDPTLMELRRVDVTDLVVNGTAKQEVIAMAVRRGVVMHHVEILRKARLTPVGLHCEPVAILDSFAHVFRRSGDENKTTFFVDIGARTTKALIAHGGQLVFSKMINVAGEHFDRQFGEELGVELDEARDRRRRQAGKPLEEPKVAPELDAAQRDKPAAAMALIDTAMAAEAGESTAPASAVAIQPAIETIPAGGEMLDCLVDELQLCIGYHRSLFADRSIDALVFIGGESRQTAMCQRIARALRLPAQLGDPLARAGRDVDLNRLVGVDLRKPQPSFAVALGLCRLPTNL